MSTYTITYKDAEIEESCEFACPERVPQPGDVYVFTDEVRAYSKVIYYPGDTLEVIERTTEAPHNRRTSLGNLRVRGKAGVSIWTNLEIGIVQGWLKLVENSP